MNYKPNITVIVPTYNEEKYIKDTLVAVKQQKCDLTYEVIVVDGQSTDNSVSIAEKFAKVYISPKKGKAFQLNHGISKTSGELVIFLDADTIIPPDFFQKIYKIFETHENLYACSARVNYHNGKAISFKIASHRFIFTQYFILNFNMHIFYLLKSLLGYPELAGCNMIVRRDILLKSGGFKTPPNSLGIDKVFSDSLIYLTKKMKKGKVRTLNFISVLTSGRHLTIKRSYKRFIQYILKKDIYYELAKKDELASISQQNTT
ncbi:MAG: glycosyltransferase family 2 protein [Candidatus Lokiarchaeota archaeon]|nr:glycosyltransferase family 2 protein [Candidatus Lokiarchaeota archaeon]